MNRIPLFEVILIGIILIFSVTLAGGLPSFQITNTPFDGKNYQLIDGPDESANQSLQLKTLVFTPSGCNPGYLSSGEPGILYATSPSPNEVGVAGGKIKLWYSDEHALTLGDGAVSAMKNHPADHVVNPQVGNTSKRDAQGFPLFPSLFLSDVATNPNTSGQALQGGTPYTPNEIYGTWKAANARDPQENKWQLPPGADPFPTTANITSFPGRRFENEFGSEVIWDIDSLPLTKGHSYVVQFVLHDGDQNRNGGDIGIGCTTINF